jgi:hypothetical protein
MDKAIGLAALFFALLVPTGATAQGLGLKATDVRVVPRDDGLHLVVRQLPGVASVMVTEAFELPDHKVATYSWKGLEPNAVNQAERRLLNGQFLKGPNLFLISSTVIADPLFGPAFEILIPPVMEYGSKTVPNSRYGRLEVTRELSQPGAKVWFSLRTFAKPYQDYTGAYRDNAFELSTIVLEQALPLDHSYYVKGNEDLFRRLGTTFKAHDADDGVKFLKTLFRDNVDLVLCLDLTKSMTVDLKALKSDLLPGLAALTAGLKNFRLGLVLYKDYGELYVTKTLPLASDPARWIQTVGAAEAAGGGDIPEAVIEALDAGLGLFDAGTADRMLVVFGDAPQHDSPRGKVKESEVLARVADAHVTIQTVLLPVTDY